MLKRESGYSLITVLIALAITSALLTAILLIVDMVSKAVSRHAATDNIEAAVRTVRSILANRDLCDNALRQNSATAKVLFNPPSGAGAANYTQDVERVYLQNSDGEPGATVVLSRGGMMGVGYSVQRMFVKERVPDRARGTVLLDGVTYATYAAELAIEFVGGVGMRRRSTPFNAVVHPGPDNVLHTGDDYIAHCYADASVQYMCEQLGGTYVDGNCQNILATTNINCRMKLQGRAGDCPADPPNVTCDNLYYVVGFILDGSSVNATPECRCQKICRPGTRAIGSGVGGAAAAAAAASAGGN